MYKIILRVYLCVAAHEHVCAYLWIPEINLAYTLNILFQTRFLTGLQLAKQVWLAGQQVTRICLSPPLLPSLPPFSSLSLSCELQRLNSGSHTGMVPSLTSFESLLKCQLTECLCEHCFLKQQQSQICSLYYHYGGFAYVTLLLMLVFIFAALTECVTSTDWNTVLFTVCQPDELSILYLLPDSDGVVFTVTPGPQDHISPRRILLQHCSCFFPGNCIKTSTNVR